MKVIRAWLFLLLVVFSATLAIWAGYSGKVDWRHDEIGILGKDLNEMRHRHIVRMHQHYTATDSLVIYPALQSFVMIDNNTANATNSFTATTTGAVDGQLLYIYNDSATSTSGIATITTQKIGVLMYADSKWVMVSDE